MSRTPVVIAGAGHAGVQVAASLRDEGYDGPVTLIGDEPDQPYHRPPLSKTYVTTDCDLDPLRGTNYFAAKSIDFLADNSVVEINPGPRRVHLRTGETLSYSHLVLAVGSRNRRLPVPGAELDGVLSLRTAHEARELRQRLRQASHVVVIGGGFIGMEFAAAAAKSGVQVVLLEAASRTMARAVTEPVSAHLERNQFSCGVQVEVGVGVSAIEGRHGKVSGVLTAQGRRYPADLVLVGVGARANSEIAAAAGLEVGSGSRDGVVVDGRLRTTHPDISAIGDCARFPNGGVELRLESVQNAVDQARFVASQIVGTAVGSYQRVPWFWSDQGCVKLQIAGLGSEADRTIVRGDVESGKFSLIGLSGDRVVAVESINKPGDHMAARKLLATRAKVTDQEAADTSFPLKSAADRAVPSGVRRTLSHEPSPTSRPDGGLEPDATPPPDAHKAVKGIS